MDDIIVAKKLYKEYLIDMHFDMIGKMMANKVIALNEVDFRIKKGEFIAIMGPSGSGKSTFINLISTIDEPSKGTVYIEGKNIRELSERSLGALRHKTIGFVFQDFNMIDGLKVKENIAIPLSLMNATVSYIKDKISEVSKRLGIEDLLEKYPAECSGGQVQRIAIARAIIAKPKIIIADEPTGNLDSKNSNAVMKLFKELNEKDGITILMVTHDAVSASFAHKVLNIKDGKIDNTMVRGEKTQRTFFDEVLNMSSEDVNFLD